MLLNGFDSLIRVRSNGGTHEIRGDFLFFNQDSRRGAIDRRNGECEGGTQEENAEGDHDDGHLTSLRHRNDVLDADRWLIHGPLPLSDPVDLSTVLP